MTLCERQSNGVTIFDIEGRVTVQDGAEALGRALDQLIQKGESKLVVNCERIPYIDTSGISEFVRGYTSLTRRGGSLKLLKLTPHVSHVLAVTRLLAVFDVFTDEGAAIDSFRTKP